MARPTGSVRWTPEAIAALVYVAGKIANDLNARSGRTPSRLAICREIADRADKSKDQQRAAQLEMDLRVAPMLAGRGGLLNREPATIPDFVKRMQFASIRDALEPRRINTAVVQNALTHLLAREVLFTTPGALDGEFALTLSGRHLPHSGKVEAFWDSRLPAEFSPQLV